MRFLSGLWLLLVPAALAAQSPATVKRAVGSITPEDVRRRIGILADDSMRGRDTPSPEIEKVANYIAGEFRRFGLKPGGDGGTYFQRYGILRQQVDTSMSFLLVGGPKSVTLKPGADVNLIRVGQPLPVRDVTGPVVLFTGPADSTDPLGGADVKGTWVARDGTAASALGIEPPTLRAAPAHGVRRLEGVTLTLRVRQRVLSQATAPNVIGILEGSDPKLKHEYIFFTAHMDHVGVAGPNGTGGCRAQGADSICNGADDDASGTVAVIENAEAFSRLSPRPKRSLVFMTVSGEEKGLWGSQFFSDHPTLPLADIVADLNADMVGRNWTDTIAVIGKEHSDLGATLNRVSAAHPELRMSPIDDIWPQENFYFRSDHYNFARKGVPILFFFNGTHPDYHQVGDSPDKIDAEKESRIIKLVFYLGLDVANAAVRPQWNEDSYRRVVQAAR